MSWSDDLEEDFASVMEAEDEENYYNDSTSSFMRKHWLMTAIVCIITLVYLPIGFILSLPFLPFVTFFGIPYEWGGKKILDLYITLQLLPYALYSGFVLSKYSWNEHKNNSGYEPFSIKKEIDSLMNYEKENKMTNYEFYRDKTTETMMQEFTASDYESLDKFLNSEHVWTPKYKVGDIVRTETLSDAEVIVKFDPNCDEYKCISLKYIADTLLPNYDDGRFNNAQDITADVCHLNESGVIRKVGELAVDNKFFDEIARHINA